MEEVVDGGAATAPSSLCGIWVGGFSAGLAYGAAVAAPQLRL